MPRATYGPEVKRRALHLFQVLIDYAEDSLEADETALDRLRPQIQTRWKDDRQLVVRTKVRHLEALTQLTPQPCTIPQIKETLRRWLDYVECLEDNRPSASGSENWHFTLKLWHSRHDRDRNLQQFQAIWDGRRGDQEQSYQEPLSTPTEIEYTLFQTALDNQRYRNLTTNPLTTSQGLQFDVSQVYVPLPLREILPEIDLEDAPIVPFESWFQNLPDRAAIIGDPGSGKTTLLQKIVTELQAQSTPVIWISLADLQGKSLTHYLLNDWLQLATNSATITAELQTQLTQQFAQSQVWLILDAIDEIGLGSSVALSHIARELRGWLSSAKVILSCRSAIWNVGKNPLTEFRVFQNLSFSNQSIKQVVKSWFDPETSDRLLSEIRKPDRQWLRLTIQNPLRLAMLCRTWSLHQGSFPETRTALYRQFVDTFYRWKQEAFPTSLTQRIRLNQALGHLAWQALQQRKYRFTESFIEQHFPSEHLELLDLALQIGWLHPLSEQGSGETAYGFYHSTFQEYFAALVVPDWQPLQTLQYREIFLLWLGREDISADQKTQILTAMLEFDDRCNGFYSIRIHCLAAAGLAEFPQFAPLEQIFDRLLTWRFRSCLEDRWQPYPTAIVEAATAAMIETDRQSAIAALENFIKITPYPYQKWNAAYSLGRSFDPGNPLATNTIIELLNAPPQNDYVALQLCKVLHMLSPQHPIALQTLNQILTNADSLKLQRKAAFLLGKVDLGNAVAITTLTKISQTSPDKSQRQYAIDNLTQLTNEQTNPKSPHPIAPKSAPKTASQKSAPTPIQLEKMIESWERNLRSSNYPKSRERSACSLLQTNSEHPLALQTLTELFILNDPAINHRLIADSFKRHLSESQLKSIVPLLHNLLPSSYDYNPQQQEAFKLLWYIAQMIPIEDFQSA